jgi:hypothetical protein
MYTAPKSNNPRLNFICGYLATCTNPKQLTDAQELLIKDYGISKMDFLIAEEQLSAVKIAFKHDYVSDAPKRGRKPNSVTVSDTTITE